MPMMKKILYKKDVQVIDECLLSHGYHVDSLKCVYKSIKKDCFIFYSVPLPTGSGFIPQSFLREDRVDEWNDFTSEILEVARDCHIKDNVLIDYLEKSLRNSSVQRNLIKLSHPNIDFKVLQKEYCQKKIECFDVDYIDLSDSRVLPFTSLKPYKFLVWKDYCRKLSKVSKESQIPYYDLLDMLERDLRNRACRRLRLKHRIIYMFSEKRCREVSLNGDFGGLFLTLSFRPSVYNKTTSQTRRKYVLDFLKDLSNRYGCDFIANVDYGKLNGREHYHVLINVSRIEQVSKKYNFGWKYGDVDLGLKNHQGKFKSRYDGGLFIQPFSKDGIVANYDLLRFLWNRDYKNEISGELDDDGLDDCLDLCEKMESKFERMVNYLYKLINHATKGTTEGRIIYSKSLSCVEDYIRNNKKSLKDLSDELDQKGDLIF